MRITPACGKCFDSKECLQFGCQNPERRMETAKDMYYRIVGQYRRKLAPMNYEDTIKFSQEIADKAWEAGFKRSDDEWHVYQGWRNKEITPSKSTFMKSLFPLKEI